MSNSLVEGIAITATISDLYGRRGEAVCEESSENG